VRRLLDAIEQAQERPDPVCACGETKLAPLRHHFGLRWVCPDYETCKTERAAIERYGRMGIRF
jgi:hypothetical protein